MKACPYLPETKSLIKDLVVQLAATLAAKTEVVNLREIQLMEDSEDGACNTDHKVIACGFLYVSAQALAKY